MPHFYICLLQIVLSFYANGLNKPQHNLLIQSEYKLCSEYLNVAPNGPLFRQTGTVTK